MIFLKLLHKLVWWVPISIIAIILKVVSFFLGWLLIAPSIWFGKDGNYPQPWKTIFQPDDSLAIGDCRTVMVNGVMEPTTTIFQDREGAFTKAYPEWLRNYVLAVMWSCMRNPAYGWDSKVCGIPAKVNVVYNSGNDIDWGYKDELPVYTLGMQFIIVSTGHWNLRVAFVITFTTHGFLCQFGWNLRGDVVNSSIRNLKIDVAGKSTIKNKV
jgi:hypothetical protein